MDPRIDFVLNGVRYGLGAAEVRQALRAGAPDDVREHWVDVDGVVWPPKQALSLVTGLGRSEFTSHMALRQFQRLGFRTSRWGGTPGDPVEPVRPASEQPKPRVDARLRATAAAAFETLIDFLSTDLTERIKEAEAQLAGADAGKAQQVVGLSGMTPGLLTAALLVRQQAGRLNDVVHAATIVQLLPELLEPGEKVLVRPSLAAGNDPSRPFDLETDRRVAEFKLSFWKGADAMRMRGVFADLVHLAMDETGRRAQLFVVGQRPIRFLRNGTASAAWALGRSSPNLRDRFATRFGSADVSIRDFTEGPGARVELVDLTERLPWLLGGVSGE